MAQSTAHLVTKTPLPSVFMSRVKFGCDRFHPACQLTKSNTNQPQCLCTSPSGLCESGGKLLLEDINFDKYATCYCSGKYLRSLRFE